MQYKPQTYIVYSCNVYYYIYQKYKRKSNKQQYLSDPPTLLKTQIFSSSPAHLLNLITSDEY